MILNLERMRFFDNVAVKRYGRYDTYKCPSNGRQMNNTISWGYLGSEEPYNLVEEVLALKMALRSL